MTKRVVTLAPDTDALSFAKEAREKGADFLEIRNDLHEASDVDIQKLADIIDILVAQRVPKLEESWIDAATILDVEISFGQLKKANLLSHHAHKPMPPTEALELWKNVKSKAAIKHIEPVGDDPLRLLNTRELLRKEFPDRMITILPMGELALPFRAILAPGNALDYAALRPEFSSAPGQRLLEDAVRSDCLIGEGTGDRLGILGHSIAGSMSPKIHDQPFDRIDLPQDAPINKLLEQLNPYYKGFAVTAPFKDKIQEKTINTLVRDGHRYIGANTDIQGAKVILQKLNQKQITVFGQGGASWALQEAAAEIDVELQIVRRDTCDGDFFPVCIWTWPHYVDAPANLNLKDKRVAMIAYGTAGKRIHERITDCGGKPLHYGPKWFIAQAREQRRLWRDAK